MNKVFTYGIFLDEDFTNSTFARVIKREKAMLIGYKTDLHTRCPFYTIVKSKPLDMVEGCIIELTDHELLRMDRTEGTKIHLYDRIKVNTDKGYVFAYIEGKP